MPNQLSTAAWGARLTRPTGPRFNELQRFPLGSNVQWLVERPTRIDDYFIRATDMSHSVAINEHLMVQR
jgi:hypothetical protein